MIHRSTLRYRLRRIRELTGHELGAVDTRLNLHIATRAWQLLGGPTRAEHRHRTAPTRPEHTLPPGPDRGRTFLPPGATRAGPGAGYGQRPQPGTAARPPGVSVACHRAGTPDTMMGHCVILDASGDGEATTIRLERSPGPANASSTPHHSGNDQPISEAARRKHDALFGDRVSTLAQTDPELMECFTNFAFGRDPQADSDLDPPTRLIVQLAGWIACLRASPSSGFWPAKAAFGRGLTPVQLKEIVYQAVPYVGMAKVVDFLT